MGRRRNGHGRRWFAVHPDYARFRSQPDDAGNAYNVFDNGYKLPLMYLVMFVPLLQSGPGKLSLNHWLSRRIMAG